ncbi:MAG: 4Fe-4S binding protein [Sedimentibacter sp.]|uniref:4Fe-4S binding protein n=1 Tax=Sedimentibacter sp. TaxID=1960295 RepID=UPI0031591EFB
MKLHKRNALQLFFILLTAAMSIIYFLYIRGLINFRILSPGDMNPYGGWSAIKSYFTDLSYRINGVSRSMALTAAVTLTSFLFGRFFCGFVCPIGAVQDFFRFLGSRLNIREFNIKCAKNFKPESIKYAVLLAVLVLSILDKGNMISPYSPWLAYVNLFMGFNVNKGTAVLLLLVFVSIFSRRIFCRMLCPFGAFQSLLFAVGSTRIQMDKRCKSCTRCLKDCPVGIEEPDHMVQPECVCCMECTDSRCGSDAGGFELTFAGRKIGNKKYITYCLVLFAVVYLALPVLKNEASLRAMASVNFFSDGTYRGSALGFGGEWEVEVEISNSEVRNIKTISCMETEGYYEEVEKEMGREIIISQSLSPDTVSGATASSRGFLGAVKDAVGKSIQ